jgi:hypothetical protein
MTDAYELVVLKQEGDSAEFDENVVTGVLNSGFSAEGPVKKIPPEYQNSGEIEEDPDTKMTGFTSEEGGRIDLVYTRTDGKNGYFGVYLVIEDSIMREENPILKIRNTIEGIIKKSSPSYVCLSDGEDITLPDANDPEQEPSLAKVTFFSNKLLDRFDLHPEITDADIVEELADGVLVIPSEEFDDDIYKQVASQMDLDHTYL